MLEENLKIQVKKLWEGHSNDISCIERIMDTLNNGKIRVTEKINGKYVVNEYIKKAILLYFKHSKSKVIEYGGTSCFDKVPLKTTDWTEEDFINAGFRAVPGAIIRYSAHMAVYTRPCIPSSVYLLGVVNCYGYVIVPVFQIRSDVIHDR